MTKSILALMFCKLGLWIVNILSGVGLHSTAEHVGGNSLKIFKVSEAALEF